MHKKNGEIWRKFQGKTIWKLFYLWVYEFRPKFSTNFLKAQMQRLHCWSMMFLKRKSERYCWPIQRESMRRGKSIQRTPNWSKDKQDKYERFRNSSEGFSSSDFISQSLRTAQSKIRYRLELSMLDRTRLSRVWALCRPLWPPREIVENEKEAKPFIGFGSFVCYGIYELGQESAIVKSR